MFYLIILFNFVSVINIIELALNIKIFKIIDGESNFLVSTQT